MRIVVTAAGSRGDVQPGVALGVGLRAAGHEVVLASWEAYRGMAENRGLAFHGVAGPDPGELVKALVEAGRNPLKYAGAFRSCLRPHAGQGLRDCLEACADADAVIYTPLGFAGYMAAEHRRIPAVGSVVTPLFVRSGRFPSAVLGRPVGGSSLVEAPIVGGLYCRLSHRAVEQLYWRAVQPLVADAREEAGLSPLPTVGSPIRGIHARRQPLLLGWSNRVLPAEPDRYGWMHTTGYWHLEPEKGWRPPERLRRFLEAGDPPVALGLGSMGAVGSATVRRIAGLAARALELSGMRGVLVVDHGGINEAGLPEGVITVAGGVPYGWLFPRVAVAVHHGGAGTTAEALRAGVPSVVIPTVPDQAFWGWRIASLGVGPAPIPPHKLTAEKLRAAILQAATDAEMRRRCRSLSEQLAGEDGVTRAVGIFERLATSPT